MNKVIVISEGMEYPSIKVEAHDKLIVIGAKDASIPIWLVADMEKWQVEFRCIENGSDIALAYEVGRAVGPDESRCEVYTSIPELKELFAGKAKNVKKPRQTKTETKTDFMNAPEPLAKEDIVKEVMKQKKNLGIKVEPMDSAKVEIVSESVKKKVNTEKPAVTKKGRPTGTKDKKTAGKNGGYFSHVTEADIDKFMKKNGLDEKFKAPIMNVLGSSGANEVTVDIMIRTQVAPLTDDKQLCARIGELVKETFVKKN